MVVGIVRDTSGSNARGANVRAEWQLLTALHSPVPRVTTARFETRTTAGGRYAVCGVPRGVRLSVHATNGHASDAGSVEPARTRAVRRIDLTLHTP
jgi:hypothetical protein